MANPVRVGIVGASAAGGWAKVSHVPAVQKLAGMELAAVATRSRATADAAAAAFGAKRGYGEPAALFRDPAVDLVAVCVKVPNHRELVLAALAAGKHVYCEWPLSRNPAEAEDLAAAARAAGVHAAVGLKARMNPAARRAGGLVAVGAIGRPLSARVYSTAAAFGPAVPAAMAFAERGEGGATLVTIQGGHTIDLAVATLGRLTAAAALATTQYPEVKVGDAATRHPRSTPDHLLVQARLAGGGVLSVEVAGGHPGRPRSAWK